MSKKSCQVFSKIASKAVWVGAPMAVGAMAGAALSDKEDRAKSTLTGAATGALTGVAAGVATPKFINRLDSRKVKKVIDNFKNYDDLPKGKKRMKKNFRQAYQDQRKVMGDAFGEKGVKALDKNTRNPKFLRKQLSEMDSTIEDAKRMSEIDGKHFIESTKGAFEEIPSFPSAGQLFGADRKHNLKRFKSTKDHLSKVKKNRLERPIKTMADQSKIDLRSSVDKFVSKEPVENQLKYYKKLPNS